MRNFLAAAATAVSDLLPGTLPVDSCLIYGTRRQPPRAATVTLPLQGTTIRNRPVPEDAQRHDYVLRVRMPAPGVSTRYQVTEAVPGESEPLRTEGFLVSTRS
jgi:hypothetical protein